MTGSRSAGSSPLLGGDTVGTVESFGSRHTPCLSAGHTLSPGGEPSAPGRSIAAASPPALPGYRRQEGSQGWRCRSAPRLAARWQLPSLQRCERNRGCVSALAWCKMLHAGPGHRKAAGTVWHGGDGEVRSDTVHSGRVAQGGA